MLKLKFIGTILIIGFAVSVIFHYAVANYIGYNYYPFNTFLFNPTDRFNDFFNIYDASENLDPYSHSVSVYFPFTYILMFFHTFINKKIAFLLFTFIFISSFSTYIYKNIPSSEKLDKIYFTFVFSFMSYPFLFAIDRGNVEIWLFLSLLLFSYFYGRRNYPLCVVFLSIAISMKLYPAVLGLIFLIDKKYKEIVFTTLLTLTLTLLSMSLLKGGIVNSYYGLLNCLSKFDQDYILGGVNSLQHNISLFAPLKGVFYYFAKDNSTIASYENLFNISYFIFAIVLFICITVILFKLEFSNSKKITLLILTFLLLPQISYDYKLINIYIPLFLFINSFEKSKFELFLSTLFGLLLIPKDYYIIIADVSIAVIINPVLIFLLITTIIYEAALNRNLKLT